ncbi:geranylgeranylglycerol-phosphate geranylgeranyltransferase [Halocatena salina]|uniref:Digeranylgeranylglyceryl phosphate synthase n=1 Tax=Halocatena salina TaxID=2934340 RepID=A0A8U0A263_9EURY|nr:geranylgeranylglycerol-phosphate geranylgeranyltransferase [Halocatena salina]UPM43154.1 geranylgeranylglycerol-phosphate geranylgeranyltransferase [Halocatena salina]
MNRLRGLIELTRPVNALAAGILTLIGAYVGSNIVQHLIPVGAASVATVLATGAGNAVNDYFDREIDRINAPDRPIPRGDVSPRGALTLSIGLFAAAVGISLVLPWLAIAIAVVNLIALVAYTELFKGLPGVGNVVVACLGGSTFLFGGAAVESGSLETVAILALLAALSTICREIVKDVEDIDGDRQEGLNTLPIAIGARPALFIALVSCLATVFASPIPYLDDTFGRAYLAVVIPADLVLLGATMEAFRNPSAAQSHMKYGMFLAAAAFIAGRAVV